MPDTQEIEPFDPKRVLTVVGQSRLMCPEHLYPIMGSSVGPVCFHHTCKFDWPALLVQLPSAFEPSQAASILRTLPLARAVEVYLDLQRADRDYARELRKQLPDSVAKAARHAAKIPAGAVG